MSIKKQLEPLYDEICAKLIDYEHDKDPENTDADWLGDFYVLLVKVQNAIETIEE